MNRDEPFLDGEVYHVYNRGANKQDIFTTDIDYARFQLLLFVSNSIERVHLGNLLSKYKGPTFINIYEDAELQGSERLVDVLAYVLMPNHFHLILRQKREGGISAFLKKVATGYSMYFNKKYEHSGTLFQGRFKSKHVGSGDYLRWLFAYVYLNPLDLHEKKKSARKERSRYSFVETYPYGSFMDAKAKNKHTAPRLEAHIIDSASLESDFAADHETDIRELREIIKDRPL